MSLIRDINNILEYGSKTTTYKYATLLSIFDYIIELPSEPPVNNFHFIPIIYLAKQFLAHYYPFSFYDYYQASLPLDSELAIIKYIEQFKDDIKSTLDFGDEIFSHIRSSRENGIFWINRLYQLPRKLPNQLIKTLWKIRKRILYQPLKYLHNVKGEIIRFFGIVNDNTKFSSAYDEHRKEAMNQNRPTPCIWLNLLEYDQTHLTLEDMTFKELSKYRFWAREVILKAWYNYSMEGEKKKKQEKKNLNKLYKMFGYIYSESVYRDKSLMSHYRILYQELGLNNCLYSGRELKNNQDFHLDHLFPWSYYPINRFWNLYPATSEINIKKSNYLPNWTTDLEDRIREHIERCVFNREKDDYNLISNDLAYFYQILQKNRDLKINTREDSLIVDEILTFLKGEWNNLRNLIPGKLFEFD